MSSWDTIGSRPDIPQELIDAHDELSWCCSSAVHQGPHACTCWTAVYDLEQQDPRPGPSQTAAKMCGDCAFRPSSPERSGDLDYCGSDGELDYLVVKGTPFYCHAGMRRPLLWRHPLGLELPAHADDYHPPVVDNIPYQADGSPAIICGGWGAWRRQFEGSTSGTP